MKAIIITALAASILASCTFPGVKTPISPTNTETPTQSGTTQAPISKEVAEKGDIATVDYVGKFEDGKIFDSSIESEAKKSDNYSAGRTYSPFEVTLVEGG